jgi:DNA-3-methyladenine glycosylase
MGRYLACRFITDLIINLQTFKNPKFILKLKPIDCNHYFVFYIIFLIIRFGISSNMLNFSILPQNFYLQEDVVQISKKLLGKIIVTKIDEQLTLSRIVETEAYNGSMDKACHAYLNRRTARTEVMFKGGGRSYVYLCYGLHHLFNIVTNCENEANAVLIRAVEPIYGLDTMGLRRKNASRINLTNGPGKLTSALGITKRFNDMKLYEPDSAIWIAEENSSNLGEIIQTTRVGVDYAQEDAQLPWRFYIRGNPFVSKKSS